jgi:Fibronectin type III domain
MRRALAAGTITVALAAPAHGQVSLDRTDPVVRLSAPAFASDTSRDRHFRLHWQGSDAGSGIAGYRLEVRPKANVSTRWLTLQTAPNARTATFRGRPGHAYLFRVRARDLAGNLSRYAYADTVVPLDDRSARVRRSRGWRLVADARAYGRGVSRARGPGHTMRLAFRGDRVAVIAGLSPQGGRLLVTIGKRSRVVSLAGRRRHRQVVFRSRPLRPGLHLLHLRSLSRGVVDLDGVGVDTGPPPPRS